MITELAFVCVCTVPLRKIVFIELQCLHMANEARKVYRQ